MFMNKPNVLFFFTDDQRFDTINCLGNQDISTPNIDSLISEGTVFTNAHIPGGSSGAVCMPSRAMLHTGKTLFNIKDEGQEIPSYHTTMGECFRSNGYETFGVGKWHNGRESYARSFTCGDKIFFGGMEDHWNVPVYDYDPEGKYCAKKPYIKDPFYSNKKEYRECDKVFAGVHSTDLFTDAAENFIEERNSKKPFFMYLSFMAPHDPRTMPKKYFEMYDPKDIELPENFAEAHLIDTGALDGRDEVLAAKPRNPEEVKRHIAEYYAMITHLDDALGKVISKLKSVGEYENTIIVFAGDNGLALGQHGLMGKQCLYEHSIRVPLIFSGPGINAKEECKRRVLLSNIYATLCDLCRIPIPESVECESLYETLADKDKDGDDNYLYLAYETTIRGLKNNEFKLIQYVSGEEQFFNLKNDPLEMNNLINEKSVDHIIDIMRKELIKKSYSTGDRAHRIGKIFWDKKENLTIFS